jgi:hypothetical protein
LQEITTDEAAWTWQNDAGVKGLKEMSWSAINPIVNGLYYRSFFQITLCNDFIRESSDANLSKRGITGTDADNIRKYRAEARFIRAYQYWVLMDMFGNPPFATENDAIGTTIPKQIQRKDLFNYIESELKAIENDLIAPGKTSIHVLKNQRLGHYFLACISMQKCTQERQNTLTRLPIVIS